jgi:hypothetical protein
MTGLRTRRWLRGTFASTLVVGGVAAALYLFALPPFARARIAAALRDAGIADSSFQLKSITWRGMEIESIRLGNPAWASIDSARGRYDLWSLLRGRFTTVDITGASWRVRLVDGKLVLGPELTPPASDQPPDLPFDELRVVDSALVLQTGEQEQLFPLSVTISRTAPSRARVGISTTAAVSFSSAGLAGAGKLRRTRGDRHEGRNIPDSWRRVGGEEYLRRDPLVLSRRGSRHGETCGGGRVQR